MTNPFERRATEYLRDDEAFLSVVTPEPLTTFFEKPAKNGQLFEMLSLIVGNPGSGKTTLARLFEFQTLTTLLGNRDLGTYKPLMDTLTACRAIDNDAPAIIACRIPLESEYRDFWEFPYPDELKFSLMHALLQARAVLAWFRNLELAGVDSSKVKVIPRPNSVASVDEIGGTDGPNLVARARDIERAVYRISAALIPPPANQITGVAASAYRPFDVIERLAIDYQGQRLELPVLVIFDDAHSLHTSQLDGLTRWLARRELRIARWIITRFDALTSAQVLTEPTDAPGLAIGRDVNEIRMQSSSIKGMRRTPFRKMSRDMASRYLRQMTVFQKRGINDLAEILATATPVLTAAKRAEIQQSVTALANRLALAPATVAELEAEIDRYFRGSQSDGPPELRATALKILMERYVRRNATPSLFDELDTLTEEETIRNSQRMPKASASLVEGARVHLLHTADRPLFFGLDLVSDASSENAELFLRLCGRLVAQSETQLIRAKSGTLDAKTQNRLLRERAGEIIREWDFPHANAVRKLADKIALQCVEKSLEPNASLGAGATAFGIPESQFAQISERHPDLAQALKYGVAYNAFEIDRSEAKHREWRLIQLGGPHLLRDGLTLKRGGFLERSVQDLVDLLVEGS